MKSRGFSLVELIIVVVIIAVAVGIAVWTMQNRAPHFRLTRSTRDVLALMKLAQASAIRANVQYRLRTLANGRYDFQKFSPGLADFTVVPGGEGKLSLNGFGLDSGIQFTGGPCTPPCNAVVFRADGTLGSSGTQGLTNGPERFNINWNIGGGIRIQ